MDIAIVGAGPAGLIAAENLAGAGYNVVVFERMPSPARKMLMAGRGGLNLTHSEPLDDLLQHYRPHEARLLDAIRAFPPDTLIAWANGLGITTFTGSSRRVFPDAMKASPLVRAWLSRLAGLGVRLERDRQLIAITPPAPGGHSPSPSLTFVNRSGDTTTVTPRATLLALGGASWPRLGSDGGWVQILQTHGIDITTLEPTNSGLIVPWSSRFIDRYAGTPLKRIVLSVGDIHVPGELVVTRRGLEGTPAYTANPLIRAALAANDNSSASIAIDLRPDLQLSELEKRLTKPRGKQSLSTFLRKSAGLSPLAIALLHEGQRTGHVEDANSAAQSPAIETTPAVLATRIKALSLGVTGLAGMDRAISTAGGIAWSAIDENFMFPRLPGVFAAGEMLDWEAPPGGYLFQGCFATGVGAAKGIERYLTGNPD